MLESLRRKLLEGAGSVLENGTKALNEAADAGKKALAREARQARIREIALEVGLAVIASKNAQVPAESLALVDEARRLSAAG